MDYTVPFKGREFGSVFLGDKNVSSMVVSEGWAKAREQGQQKGEASPFLAEFLRLEEQAKQQGKGRWSRTPGASETSVRNLPPSAISDPINLDAMVFLASNKGRPMQAIEEQVRNGSTLRVYLLPEFLFVQVFVAGMNLISILFSNFFLLKVLIPHCLLKIPKLSIYNLLSIGLRSDALILSNMISELSLEWLSCEPNLLPESFMM